MNIFYWSPFISNVATISSVMRSADSLVRYSNESINVSLIDSIGEWKDQKKKINPKINIIKLNNNNFYNLLPRGGFIRSRLSYLIIFFLNFNKLKNLINNEKPDYLIIHLMTSLPIFLTLFFKSKTKIILRLSGLPKLNIIRYFFWKLFSNKIYKVTCPTLGTYNSLLKKNIFPKDKLYFLRDPAVLLNDYVKKKFEKIINFELKQKKIIIGIGRLTKQKNFNLLINAFHQIQKKYSEYELFILGEGEKKIELTKLTNKYGLEKKVHFFGYQENVYKYLKKADCFILTSLWEDPGFVLLEAGLSNTSIISSDCKNGPREILDNGNNGYLFENNNLNSLLEKFDEFKKTDKIKLREKKINLKKELRKFTLYSHYNSLKKIINFDD
jgi:glycosyltransferase involved in cell wall biosynthesis